MIQTMGDAYQTGLPVWFQEGLAAFVWEGGGTVHGLQRHVFYRQSAMFVEYLHDRDLQSYQRFLKTISQGTPFRETQLRYSADQRSISGVNSSRI